jgi:putative phosphoribosyl transferase
MAVANALNTQNIATLLFDLLVPKEEADRANVFDIPLLADRLVDAIDWLEAEPLAGQLPLGLFGASTGAAAALVAAARRPQRVGAIVSRGGRPDLAGDVLDKVRTPTLLIVGGIDFGVIELNEAAFVRLRGPKALEIVPNASHLFPERGFGGGDRSRRPMVRPSSWLPLAWSGYPMSARWQREIVQCRSKTDLRRASSWPRRSRHTKISSP